MVIKQVRPKTSKKNTTLLAAFKDIRLQVFVEVGRIKKPSRAALITGQMLCEYVIAMRVFFTQSLSSEPHEFTEWH